MRDALLLGRRHLELVLEVLEVLLHPAGLLVERVERLQRRQVLRIDRQDLLVGVDGAVVVAQPVLPQLADLQLEADRLLGVVDDLRLLGEHVDQAVPGLRAAVQPLERVDRVDAVLVGVERALVGGHRLRRVAQLRLVGVGQGQQDLDARRRLLLALGVARQRADQVAPALLLADRSPPAPAARRCACRRAAAPAAPRRSRSRRGAAPSRTSARSSPTDRPPACGSAIPCTTCVYSPISSFHLSAAVASRSSSLATWSFE